MHKRPYCRPAVDLLLVGLRSLQQVLYPDNGEVVQQQITLNSHRYLYAVRTNAVMGRREGQLDYSEAAGFGLTANSSCER